MLADPGVTGSSFLVIGGQVRGASKFEFACQSLQTATKSKKSRAQSYTSRALNVTTPKHLPCLYAGKLLLSKKLSPLGLAYRAHKTRLCVVDHRCL